MQRANLTGKVYLIEDNSLANQKTTNIYANMIKKKNIKKVDWLANFLDLYPIQDI